jgi:hypothetical protein
VSHPAAASLAVVSVASTYSCKAVGTVAKFSYAGSQFDKAKVQQLDPATCLLFLVVPCIVSGSVVVVMVGPAFAIVLCCLFGL